jgi:hypothetical protein
MKWARWSVTIPSEKLVRASRMGGEYVVDLFAEAMAYLAVLAQPVRRKFRIGRGRFRRPT